MNANVKLTCVIGENCSIETKSDGRTVITVYKDCEFGIDVPMNKNVTQTKQKMIDENFDFSLEVVSTSKTENIAGRLLAFIIPFKVTNEECWDWADQQSGATIHDIQFSEDTDTILIRPLWADDLTARVRDQYEHDFYDYFAEKMQTSKSSPIIPVDGYKVRHS